MRAYAYTAYTAEGRRRTGTVVAESESDAARILKGQGLFASDLAERRSSGPRMRMARSTRLSPDLQAVFTRQMAVLLGAELGTEAALDAVRASAGKGALDAVAARAKADVMQGEALSDALETSGAGFARYYIAALRAGETAGDVGGVFIELADHLESQGTDRAQIGAALIYPAFVAAVSLVVCGILMVSVAPQIVEIFEISGRPLPALTVFVLTISDWLFAHPYVPFGVLIGGGLGWAILARVPRLRARRDAFLLRIPLVGRLMRLDAAVQYLRTMALVLTARHAVLNAVDSAGEVLHIARFQDQSAQVSIAVHAGESLSAALRKLSFVPLVAQQLVAAGEASARVAPMSARAAILVENDLKNERKRIAALLEPMLMIVVGVMVLVIVLAVLLPIFDLQAVVSG